MEEQLARPAPIATSGLKLIIGLFFAVLGLLFTLDNLNLFDPSPYLRYWPAVLIAIGLLKIRDPLSRGFSIVAIVVGAVLLALNTRWLRFSIFDLWPLLLIAAGVYIVAQAFGGRPLQPAGGWVAVLSPRKITIDSHDFKGGRAAAIMGVVELDLTAADIEHGPAVIEVFVVMGGVGIKIPDGWEVIGDAVPFMGGIDIKTKSKSTGRQLIVRGLIVMGGMEIKDVSARTK